MIDVMRRLDLNLLITLDALIAELNVTRAARRLHLSQPAVSVQLGRLREYFEDPLLLPGPRGMRPTARANELREPLRNALATLTEAILPSTPFDPRLATQTWRIAAFDYGEFTILLPALARIRAAAPGSRLAILQSAPAQVAIKADQGEIDLSLMTAAEAPQDLHSRSLFTERYVLAGRIDHPQLKRRPTLAQFCKLDHVIASPDGGGFQGVTDVALAKLGMARRVAMSVPHFLFLVTILERSDLVALVPSRLIQGSTSLRVVEPPLDVPGFEMVMVWPERIHRDPAHRWLRQQIVDAV